MLDWLLDSDPAIRWQVRRDLADAPPDTPGTAAMPGIVLPVVPWPDPMFMPWVLPVFCEAVVD